MKKMKHKRLFILIISLVLILIFALISILMTSGFCDHEWLKRGCGYPDVCTKCGKELDFYIEEHLWADVKCMEQEYCVHCGLESNKEPGHTWEDATCLKAKFCKICAVTEGEPLEHRIEWVIDKPAGYFVAGQRTQACTSCNQTFSTEDYHKETYVKDGCFEFTMENMVGILNSWLKKYLEGEAKIDTMGENSAIITMTYNNSVIGIVEFYTNGNPLTPEQTDECVIDKIELLTPEPLVEQRIKASWYVLWLCAPPAGDNEKTSAIYSELIKGFTGALKESPSSMPVYTATHGDVTYSMTAELDSDDTAWYVSTIVPSE